MKKYADYTQASISMTQDDNLKRLLAQLATEKIEIMIETGTYNGLGSTTFLAESFKKSPSLQKFYTIEVNPHSFQQAKKNLSNFPKVECIYGSSVNLQKAIEFVQNDEAIKNHLNYPEIFIDDTENPVDFYTNELKSLLEVPEFSAKDFLKNLFLPKRKEGLLQKLVQQHYHQSLFIILDSAGGVGCMEFERTLELLETRPFYVLLDDTHHLKHFRSLQKIQQNPDFKILGLSETHGWCLAKYL